MTDDTRSLPVQGVHHITLVGADRRTTIDFWEGVLGMPFVFEQPNRDDPEEGHLYFDPGDGRLITVFTRADRAPVPGPAPTPGAVHHLAFAVSAAVFAEIPRRLEARGIAHSGVKDRGFMDSIYFRDPLGLTIELSCNRFVPPPGAGVSEVLIAAHRARCAEGAAAIESRHVAHALEEISGQRDSLSRTAV